jgi:serine/threonine-protein kinase
VCATFLTVPSIENNARAEDRAAKARTILEGALLRPEAERLDYLNSSCGADSPLREEVERLLKTEHLDVDHESPQTQAVPLADRHPLYEPPRFPAGEVLSERFRIDRLLGRGGMGEVYEAFDLQLKETVALKSIRSGASSENTIARLRYEVILARQVTHANVCRIFDLGCHKDPSTGEEIVYLTMELLKGETLADRIKRQNRIPAPDALAIAEQMAEALAAAHRASVVHRDLKPSNVILVRDPNGKSDRAVITDFGLARLVEDAAHNQQTAPTLLTGSGEILGTLVYMAPEQVRSQPVSAATDIYAFGLIFYEMLSGQRAFGEHSSLARIFKRLEGPPQPLRSLLPELNPDIDNLVLHCLAIDPAQRVASAQELAQAIRHLRGQPSHAPASSRTPSLHTSGSSSISSISEAWRRPPSDASGSASTLQVPMAVLPFANLSADPDNEYFSDGLGEELMGALAKIDGLRLVARSSTQRFRGADHDVREIGKLLNVDAVLEGSVRRSGNRLRITVKLIETANGYQLWSERYDREMEDVFVVQEEIANGVAAQLRVRLNQGAESYFRRHRAQDIEAYNLYLKGRFFWNKRTPADLRRAVEHFQSATQIDPKFAPAFAGLADSWVLLAMYGAVAPQEVFPQARQAIAQALALDPKLPDAHCTDGCIRAVFEWDWPGAEQSFRRSLELGPNYATGHHWFAINYLVPMKRFEEARHHLEAARESDPLSLVINTTIGLELFFEGRSGDAIREYRRVLEMEPGFAVGYFFLGQALLREQQHEEAIAALEHAVELSGHSSETLAMLGYAQAVAGRADGARAIQDEILQLSASQYISPAQLAQIQLALGAKADALTSLERAAEQRATDLLWLRVRPAFEALEGEPRFAVIAQSIGLP